MHMTADILGTWDDSNRRIFKASNDSLHAVNTVRPSHATKISFNEPIKISKMKTAQATN